MRASRAARRAGSPADGPAAVLGEQQLFHRDLAVQPLVARQPHDTHRTPSDERHEAVASGDQLTRFHRAPR
jgi:hypothetical protein